MTKNLIPLLDAMMVHKNSIVSAKSSEILSCIKDKILCELFNYEEYSDKFNDFLQSAPERLENPFTNEIILLPFRDKASSSVESSNESRDSLLSHKRERKESQKCKEMNNIRLRRRTRNDVESVNKTQSNMTIGSNSLTKSKEETSIQEESSGNILTSMSKPNEDSVKSQSHPKQNSTQSKNNEKITDNTRRHSPTSSVQESEIDQYLKKISSPGYNILEIKKIDSFLDKLFSMFHHSKVRLNDYSIKLLLSRVFDSHNSQVMELPLEKVDSPLECLKNLKPYQNFYKYEYSKFNKLSTVKHYMRKCLCIKYKKLFIRLVTLSNLVA